MTTSPVPLSAITAPARLRPVDPAWVEALAASFEDHGQTHPVVVRPAGDGTFILVAGAHRLAAAAKLGWASIRAEVRDLDADGARLVEIDENLMRRELSALDRAVFLAERKGLWERLYPETAHGKARKPKKEKSPTWRLLENRFSAETAERTGLSERTIQRASEIATKLAPETIVLLRETPIADNQAQLQALAREPRDAQIAIARQMAPGGARSVADARIQLGFDTPAERDPVEAAIGRLMEAWKRAPKRARERFLEEIGIDAGGATHALTERAA